MIASLQRRLVLLFLLWALLPLGSAAQQPPADPTGTLQLTLKGAVQLALKQNPQRIIAQLLVAESERNKQIARSSLLPQVGAAASGSLNQYNAQSIERAVSDADNPRERVELCGSQRH